MARLSQFLEALQNGGVNPYGKYWRNSLFTKGKKRFHPALDEQLGACQGKHNVQLTSRGQGCGK